MLIVGHRGARGEAPENTLSGFIHAFKHGINAFELDVRIAADNELVVFHDNTLDRTTGSSGNIADLKSTELINIDTRPGSRSWPCATPIPTLREVLECLHSKVHFQLEIKSVNTATLARLGPQLTTLIQETNRIKTTTVTSLDTSVLFWFKQNAPHLSRGYVAKLRIPNPISTAISLGCSHLCPNHKICTPDLVQKAHRAGLHVSPWTVNEIDDLAYVTNAGVDSIITDYPTFVNKLLN